MRYLESYNGSYGIKKESKIFRDKIHSRLWKIARTDKDWFIKRQNLGLSNIISNYLEPISNWVDGNKEIKYQKPLSFLYQTRKAEVVYTNGHFYCPKLKKRMIYVDGEWSWLNKLDTNVYAHVTLLSDYFEFLFNFEDSFKKIAFDIVEVGDFEFKELVKKYVYLDKNIYGLDFEIYLGVTFPERFDLEKYVGVIKGNTERGDRSELKAINYIMNKGWKIIHQGSNGDLIDILLGIDLIIEKAGAIRTVQVKSYSINYIDKKKYVNIDIFIGFSDNGSIETWSRKINP